MVSEYRAVTNTGFDDVCYRESPIPVVSESRAATETVASTTPTIENLQSYHGGVRTRTIYQRCPEVGVFDDSCDGVM